MTSSRSLRRPPGGAARARPRSRLGWVIVTAGLALAADIVSKVLVVANISETRPPVRLLGGLVMLVQTRNSGAAFSVGTGATVLLTAIALVVVVIIARAARTLTSAWWAVCLGLILGGAIGNLVDRLVRAPSPGRGHVVDWIQLHTIFGYDYPVFNLADSGICVGAVLALILSVRGVEFRAQPGTVAAQAGASESTDGADPGPAAPLVRQDPGDAGLRDASE